MRNMPRVYTSFMPNAPILNGVPGALLDIIKKCLIGGWTPFDVSEIVVASGVATMKFSYPNNSLPDYCILDITGCSEPLLNTEVTIYEGNDTTGKFKTTVADGTYSGAIKAAPTKADWELVFSATNQGIIRSMNDESSKICVKITDTNATTCSFDFGTDAKSISQLVDSMKATHNYDRCIMKSRNADATQFRGWSIIADNTTVYITTDMYTPGSNQPFTRDHLQAGKIYFFGDYISNDPQDSSNFASYFPAINQGDTYDAISYPDSKPTNSGTWTENWIAARPTIKTTKVRYQNWSWACFLCTSEVPNPTWRISGTTSSMDIMFVNNLEKSHKKVGVFSRGASGNTSIGLFGYLPGIRFSEYFIRSMYKPFSSSKEEETGDVYVYLPIDNTYRDYNTFDITWGFSPFIINKKWG